MVRGWLNAWVSNRVTVDIRSRLFEHFQALSLSFFDRRTVGSVMSRMTQDTGALYEVLVDGIPFTRPYPPGHARLRTRWPLYAVGMYVVAYCPVRYELWILRNSERWVTMSVGALAIITILEAAGRRKSEGWMLPTAEELEADPDSLTYLNLGPDAAVAPSR